MKRILISCVILLSLLVSNQPNALAQKRIQSAAATADLDAAFIRVCLATTIMPRRITRPWAIQ